MEVNDNYTPINCDDYDNLELACQHELILSITLRDGKQLQGKAITLQLKKRIEYLIIDTDGQQLELRLDHIANFSHPKIGTVEINLA